MHSTHSVPNNKTMSKAKQNLNGKMEAIKDKQEEPGVPVLTSLRFVEGALEIIERWMNHWPVVEKQHPVKERTNGIGLDMRQT